MRTAVFGRPIVIASSPKVASSSILQWIYAAKHGQRYDGDQLHTLPMFRGMSVPIGYREEGAVHIAVHREGFARMASAWNHWVMLRPGWQGEGLRQLCPTLDAFAEHFPEAMNRDGMVAHHCGLQVRCLGTDPGSYDITIPMAKLGDLAEHLRHRYGMEVPPIPVTNRFEYAQECSARASAMLKAYTALDALCGWDGVEVRW